MDVKQISSYGQRNPDSPQELGLFSFLVGKWQGTGRAKLDGGKFAEFPVTWIGRYILDGAAIADEFHSLAPDGSPYLGISLRQYDATRKTWIIEYLNVSNSFLRRQVNGGSGSVTVDGPSVAVISGAPDSMSREQYRVLDHDNFAYRLDASSDGGSTWDEGRIEMTFRRSE
ncbi:MAG: hypothetical protein WCC21_17670 [Candidatus Acidiferrales bacterium]